MSTKNMVLLGGFAAVFITFSLVCSFVLPRRNPNFPGERLPLFIAATVVLFVAMLIAVELWAIEEPSGEHHGAPVALVRV